MQPARVHFKKQVRQTKHVVMGSKSFICFTIICDPVDLDKILEAYDVGDGILTEPHPNLVDRYLALLHDLQTMLLVILRACMVFFTKFINFLLQNKLKVD
jgi:hypothetical protein